jgi:Holliday junction resolvase RusA-like endonuclease
VPVSDPITIVVPGAPVPKGRPRAHVDKAGNARMYTPARTRKYEQSVAAMCAGLSEIPGPVDVSIVAVMPRPKRLMRKKDHDGFIWCDRRPDADNIRKAVLDGLAPVITDDARVVSGVTLKVYAEKTGAPRTIIRIKAYDADRPHCLPYWCSEKVTRG